MSQNQLLQGALLVHKPQGISSFGVIDALKKIIRTEMELELNSDRSGPTAAGEPKRVRFRELPKLGHGGTLDPFATGLLIVCIGRGVKLSRYFLGSVKKYEACLRFGETTVPGDPTSEISERSSVLPSSLEELNRLALEFKSQEYSQTPPMHSAKKINGQVLYELAREGIEIERTPKVCTLHDFEFLDFEKTPPLARSHFRVSCSSGTYIRTLSQDFSKRLSTVGMLDTLHRTGSGIFGIEKSMTLETLKEVSESGSSWADLPGFVSFDRLLDGFSRADASFQEAEAIVQGKQQYLPSILEKRKSGRSALNAHGGVVAGHENHIVIYFEDRLLAVAALENGSWGLERVFPEALTQAAPV